MQADCDQLGINLRAHIKTHKTPEIATMQIRAGAVGICCQKLGEAEVMAAAGIEDILISYNIVGQTKLARLIRLAKQLPSKLAVTADSQEVIDGLSSQSFNAACNIRVLVEMDMGGGRCGTQSPKETLQLAQRIDTLPGLEFAGVMYYKSRDHAPAYLEEVTDSMKRAGLPLQIVSGGGTGAQKKCTLLGCTEARVGSYTYEGLTRTNTRKALHPDRNPLRIITTVVSNQRPDKVIVDAGQKSFGGNMVFPYGYCVEDPDIFFSGASVEHGHLDVSEASIKLGVGDRLSFIPQHGGMTTNLYDRIHAVRIGEVLDSWQVAARGRAH